MAVMKSGATETLDASALSLPLSPPVADGVTGQNFTTGSMSSESVGITNPELSEDSTLYGVFNHLIESIFDDQDSTATSAVNRIKESVLETAPLFRDAIQNTRRDVVLWTSRGSPFRALLVVSVGTVALVALTGMLVFLLFFLAATINAIMISLLISLAAVGGFLAIFFSCLSVVFAGALCIAASVTFTITISSIVAALVATGGVGIIWIVWLAAIKSATLVKHYLGIGGQAFPDNDTAEQNAQYWGEMGEVFD